MPGTGTYRTLIVLAGVAVVFFVLYLSGFFKPNQAPDITTDLSQFDLVGQRVEEDFSQYPLVSLSEERTLTDTLKDGVEITYGNQASTTFASPDLSESLSLQFPDSLNEPLTITLPGNRQFTVRHNTTQPHRASLLTAGTNEDTVPDTLREGSMTWPSGPERSLSEVVSGAVSPQYLKYTSEDNRLHTYYAYQKDQAAGYRNLKHWTIFQTGTGHETQSYTFSNAHLTTNDRGEVEVRYLPTNTPPEPGVEEDLWARAQRTIAADMLADIENRAPDLIIPAPYTIDAQGNQQTHEWQVTKASTIDPNDTSGDYVLSVSFDVPLLGYPIALDPTLQFTAPGVSNSGDVITGEATNSEYGKAVAIGDWNSDGKTDLAVGAHDYDDGGSTDIGRVYIFWGGESTGYAADAPVIITGEVAGDLFGYSLTSGDVNGDGTDDLLVGAYNYDVSNTEGRVYIWFGGPIESGSANTADVTLTGSIAGENTGTAIGVADYNGDGVKDVAVGAYGYTSRTGRTYIFYGPVSSDVTSNADVVYTGEAGNNFFGYAITSGDLNSDGIDDLVATARAYSVTQGRAYVFYGGSMSSSSASAADVVLSGGASSMFFGNSVTIGDLNNDGTDDLAIGAIAVSSSQGAVYIFYGGMMVSESASGADVTLTGESSTNGQFGFTLAQGDLNADGSDDLVVSAPGYDVTTNEGRVYVFYGGSIISGNATSADLIITGESTSNFFGYNALAVADLNHDGKEDLVAGAYAYNSSQGRTYIFYSQSGQVNLDQHITGEGTSDYFGKSFATGDFNNDGRDDLAVGAYLDNSNAGKVYIFYNDGDYTTLASTSDVTLTGDSSSNFGGALAVGDFNSDGVDDLVVGASIKTTLTGEVYVFYGGAMVSEGASGADVTLTGEATVSFFGSSLAVGDYDADGKDDLAVGAFLYGGSKGRTYVFYGDLVSEYASTSDVLYTNDGTAEAFGYSLATGDLNSDGIDDLIVGATGYSSNLGRAYVFYGGSLASSSDSLADVILTGTIAASAFANALTIGDFNSDGRDDLVIGAPGYSSNQGRVYIFYGNILASTTDSAADVTLTGEALSSFGTALTAGDLNHDGQTDIVVGAWQYNTYQGRTYIFYNDGSYPTAAASADIIITGDSTNDDFGHAFITGDFNADGKDDLVIGAPGYNNGGDTGRIYFYETREDYAWEIQRSPLSDGLRVDPIMGYELKITGESASNLFAAASAIGDLNNDGKDDLVVGAYSYNSNAGRVYIFYNDGSYQTKAGRADVIIEGEAATNYFGVNLEIGDLNNDGKDDLVVGATLYGGTVGRAYIFYGGGIASGNATDADVVLTGEGASNSFGSALAVGDFNADGVEDLAVSANSYSSATGRAYIFYGGSMITENASGADVTLTGQATTNNFGTSLATGDFNSDGEDDLAVGANTYGSYEGRAYIFYGGAMISENASGADAIITGEAGNSYLGVVLSSGDFNSDGSDDLVVSAHGYNSSQGRAYIFYGGSIITENASGADVTLTGEATSNSFSLDLISGDFNHDGMEDLAVGAVGYNSSQGRAYIFYGGSIITENASGADVTLDGETGYYGRYMAAGDINNDGGDDLVIGAHLYNSNQGRLYFYTTNDWQVTGAASEDDLGKDVVVGDFNNDGKNDLAVSAAGYNSNQGRTYIFYGGVKHSTTTTSADVTLTGDSGTAFGTALTKGDFNNDGVDDLVVSATSYGSGAGRTYIFYGGSLADGDASDADVTLTGEGILGYFGHSLTTGDYNADGTDDLVVGAYGYSNGGNTGRAYVFYGGSMIDENATGADVTYTGEGTSNYFGDRVATGDFDNDGIDDLVVGAYVYSNTGRAYVFYGGSMSSANASTADVIMTGVGTSAYFGGALTVGDYNADGKDDLAVGSYRYDSFSGRVYVFYNATLSGSISASSADVILSGEASSDDNLGTTLATGDFDRDGVDDLAVGAWRSDTFTGDVYLFYGDNLHTSDAIDSGVKISGEATNSNFGISLAAGDVSGDGVDDLVIGAHGYDDSSNEGRVYIIMSEAATRAQGSFKQQGELLLRGNIKFE